MKKVSIQFYPKATIERTKDFEKDSWKIVVVRRAEGTRGNLTKEGRASLQVCHCEHSGGMRDNPQWHCFYYGTGTE